MGAPTLTSDDPVIAGSSSMEINMNADERAIFEQLNIFLGKVVRSGNCCFVGVCRDPQVLLRRSYQGDGSFWHCSPPLSGVAACAIRDQMMRTHGLPGDLINPDPVALATCGWHVYLLKKPGKTLDDAVSVPRKSQKKADQRPYN